MEENDEGTATGKGGTAGGPFGFQRACFGESSLPISMRYRLEEQAFQLPSNTSSLTRF